jgi:hypothetical protein
MPIVSGLGIGSLLTLPTSASAAPWAEPLRIALQKSLLKQDIEALFENLKVYEDSQSQQTAKEVAEENVLTAFRQNILLPPRSHQTGLTTQPASDKPYEHLSLAFSANREENRGQNYSMELEIAIPRGGIPSDVLLVQEGSVLARFNQSDLYKRYPENPLLFSGRSQRLTALPKPGLYRLQIRFTERTFEELILIDEFPAPIHWPTMHKLLKLRDRKVAVVIAPPPATFVNAMPKTPLWLISASPSKEAPVWHKMLNEIPKNHIDIPLPKGNLANLKIGVTHLLKYKWGEVEIVQALNDLHRGPP